MRIVILLCLLLAGQSALASDFRVLGRASLFSNDYLGDGQDRWRSGSYSRSTAFGTGWEGDLASRRIFELRIRGELIAPTDISSAPQSGERPFVGVAAVGIARHLRFGASDLRIGAEAVAFGPQTGISSFVKEAHDVLGFRTVRATDGELGNDVVPTASFSAARLFKGTPKQSFQLRPFVEAQAGVETYARTGFDIFFGAGIAGDLLTRDVVTGHMMTMVSMKAPDSFVPSFGADVTRVWSSSYLPPSRGVAPERWRLRMRGGLRSIGQRRDVFVGFSWLSPEYQGQPEGQVIGSLSVDRRF